jgi:hypothetical protein
LSSRAPIFSILLVSGEGAASDHVWSDGERDHREGNPGKVCGVSDMVWALFNRNRWSLTERRASGGDDTERSAAVDFDDVYPVVFRDEHRPQSGTTAK